MLIRANKGKYEPEFRIWLVLPQLVFSGIGLFGFGFAAGNVPKYGWVIPDVFFMFVLIGMVMGAVASALYIVDAHRKFLPFFSACLDISGSQGIQVKSPLRRSHVCSFSKTCSVSCLPTSRTTGWCWEDLKRSSSSLVASK